MISKLSERLKDRTGHLGIVAQRGHRHQAFDGDRFQLIDVGPDGLEFRGIKTVLSTQSDPPMRVVGEAGNVVEAVAESLRQKPDLILMALTPPGGPTWEAVRTLAAQPALRHTPILGTTIYNTLLTAPRVRAIGRADFVDNPFDLDALLLRIDALLPHAPRAAFAA